MGAELQKAAQGLPPKVVKISEDLSCELNEVEWQNRARELAEAHKEVADQEQRKKDIMKELGHDVSIAKSKESKLADTVSTRRELREVTVEIKYDYDLGTVTKTRTDTGEVISEREMTDQERQAELDFQDANDVIEDIREEERAEDDATDEADDIDEGELDDDEEDLGEGDLPADEE